MPSQCGDLQTLQHKMIHHITVAIFTVAISTEYIWPMQQRADQSNYRYLAWIAGFSNVFYYSHSMPHH